jgi:uncharacterized protein YecT (DUF1311 family)
MKALGRAIFVAAVFISFAAFAENCGDLDAQSEMNDCAFREYKKVDKELNEIYNSYRARLDEGQKRQLRDVQLEWVKFRDLACAFESSGVEGGSVYPLVINYCLARRTADRVKELSALANCKEGDLSCPAWK